METGRHGRSSLVKIIPSVYAPLVPPTLTLYGGAYEQGNPWYSFSGHSLFDRGNVFSTGAVLGRQSDFARNGEGDGGHASAAFAQESGRRERRKAVRPYIDQAAWRSYPTGRRLSLYSDARSNPDAATARMGRPNLVSARRCGSLGRGDRWICRASSGRRPGSSSQ